MTSLSVALVLQLAVMHAPLVAPETVLTFAQVESRLDPLVIHSNTNGRTYAPKTVAGAVAPTRPLLARGDLIDIGLLPITSANLAKTGLTVDAAFDPANNIRAEARIMAEAYRLCLRSESGEAALHCMASRYKKGTSLLGLHSGHVARIWKAAAQRLAPTVPAIGRRAPLLPSPPADTCGSPLLLWDGWALFAHQRCVSSIPAPEPPE